MGLGAPGQGLLLEENWPRPTKRSREVPRTRPGAPHLRGWTRPPAHRAPGCAASAPRPRLGGSARGEAARCPCPSVRPAGSLPYEYKIVIAGNHELTFDQEFMADLIKQDFYYFPSVSKLKPENYENVQSLLTNCIYLQDSEVTVRGFRVYGSPW